MELDIYALLKSLAVSFFGSLLDILGRLRVQIERRGREVDGVWAE